MSMFRKPTLMQFLMQGPASIVANKWARRALLAALVAHDAYFLYRFVKTPLQLEIHIPPLPSGPVVLYRHPNVEHDMGMTENVKVKKVYARPFGMHATHYWVPGRNLGRSYVVRELSCSHSS